MTRRKRLDHHTNTAQPMWRIGVYIRLSKEDRDRQREDGDDENPSESIKNQKKILEDFLTEYFSEPYAIVDYYEDDGLTGTDDTRENFARLIRDIDQGLVNCFVCKTLARAFRNYADQGYYIEDYFERRKVRFISVGSPRVDTYQNRDAVTGMEVPISGLMNDRYAARTSEDVRRTFRAKRKRGEFIGAFAPYGYLKDPSDKNHLIVDEEIAPIKREVRNWIVRDGLSLNGAARKLNALGIPNPTAYKQSLGWRYHNPHAKTNDGLWSGTTVRRMLLDLVNLGHMAQGKQRVISYKVHDRESIPMPGWDIKEYTHEPIFSQEEYDSLERALRRDTRSTNPAQPVYLLSGFIRCADCKKAMRRSATKGNVYYRCRTHADKSRGKCSAHSIRADTIEQALLSAIQAKVRLVTSLPDIIDTISQNPAAGAQSARIEKTLTGKRAELEKLRIAADGLHMDWKTDMITTDEYTRLKACYLARIDQLGDVIAHLESEQRNLSKGADEAAAVLTAFLEHRTIKALDRSLLSELVDTIYVHENRELTIVYRFADECERALALAEDDEMRWP